MPMYEYVCSQCNQHTEIIQKFSDTPLSHCPSCGGPMSRLISPSGFILKGGGWYKDGYSNTAKTAGKTDSKEGGAICERTGKAADAGCACASQGGKLVTV
ncbi:MAG: zinc ribbon domain-containing protein [Deltaproteobacteria bacterium]|nr:zinc ribbon domain-containing protein [Deltaproteobacteria bacterium]